MKAFTWARKFLRYFEKLCFPAFVFSLFYRYSLSRPRMDAWNVGPAVNDWNLQQLQSRNLP